MKFLKSVCRKFSKFFDCNSNCCVEKVAVTGRIELLDEYQFEAAKTFKSELANDRNEALKYLGLKLSEECGEINGPIAKHLYHGKDLDIEEVKGELSDLLWYLSNMAGVLGFSLSEVATYNIDKLRARHGENYKKEYYVQ